MSPAQIHKQFAHLMRTGKEGAAERSLIGMPITTARWYRFMHSRNKLSLTTQIRWLKASGVDVGTQNSYSAADMIAFAKYARHPRHAEARKLGWPYLLEKWEASKAMAQP
jgi:hypothetical protein